MIVKTGKSKLPEITVTINGGLEIKGKKVKDGHLEFEIAGDSDVKVNWH